MRLRDELGRQRAARDARDRRLWTTDTEARQSHYFMVQAYAPIRTIYLRVLDQCKSKTTTHQGVGDGERDAGVIRRDVGVIAEVTRRVTRAQTHR